MYIYNGTVLLNAHILTPNRLTEELTTFITNLANPLTTLNCPYVLHQVTPITLK